MKTLRSLFLVLLIAALGACSSIGAVAPQSPSQDLAYAYGTVASVRTSAANALAAGTISATQAQAVLGFTDKARAALDAGEQVVVSGVPDTNGSVAADLALATQLLTQAQALLPQLQK